MNKHFHLKCPLLFWNEEHKNVKKFKSHIYSLWNKPFNIFLIEKNEPHSILITIMFKHHIKRWVNGQIHPLLKGLKTFYPLMFNNKQFTPIIVSQRLNKVKTVRMLVKLHCYSYYNNVLIKKIHEKKEKKNPWKKKRKNRSPPLIFSVASLSPPLIFSMWPGFATIFSIFFPLTLLYRSGSIIRATFLFLFLISFTATDRRKLLRRRATPHSSLFLSLPLNLFLPSIFPSPTYQIYESVEEGGKRKCAPFLYFFQLPGILINTLLL